MLVVLLCAIALAPGASADEVRQMSVAEDGFAAAFYPGHAEQPTAGVLVLGGAEGGKPTLLAKLFADAGYPTLALAYFRAAGTPTHLDLIPLEYFDCPIAWLAEQPALRGKPIVAVGASKGAELTLLLASRKREIRGVIAIAPSSVVFQGIPKVFFPPRSSWSYEDQPLPFVPFDLRGGVDPKNLLPLYERSLTQGEKVEKAAIPVEQIAGPILLLSGSEDSLWPSSKMARAVVRRLEEHSFPHDFEHVDYPDAGHTLSEFFMLGGTREGNQQARTDSQRRMLEFLERIKDDGGRQQEDNGS